MRRSKYLVLILSILFVANCGEQATEPQPSESSGTPVFKPKCDTPPCKGGDDPPPPADQAILYSGSSRDHGSMSIFRMNADGSNVDLVFGDAVESGNHNVQPAWAPDGERFTFRRVVRVFEKRRVVSSTEQIAVGHEDGTVLAIIREVPDGPEPLYRPRWSPSPVEDRIAWVENRVVGQASIVMARRDPGDDTWDTESVLVAGPDEHFGNMTWSQSGEQILVEGWYESSQQSFLRLYDVDCLSSCTATAAADLDLWPLSPNGSFGHLDWAHLHDWVLVRVIPAGSSFGDLWLIDMDTGDVRPVTQTSIDVQDAVWSSCDDQALIVVWGQFGRHWSNKLIRLNLSGLPSGTPWDGSLDDPAIAEVIADVNPAGFDWRPTSSTVCGS